MRKKLPLRTGCACERCATCSLTSACDLITSGGGGEESETVARGGGKVEINIRSWLCLRDDQEGNNGAQVAVVKRARKWQEGVKICA